MRVTDEMVEVALAAYVRARGTYEREVPADRDDIRAALEAALSHAAGQEAVVPTCEECGATFLELHECKEPAWEKVGVLDGYGRITGEPKVRMIDRRLEPGTLLYKLTAAPPTTSAEVGRNSDRYLWLKENAPDAHMWSDESIDAAMAASSGRQGD